MFSWSEDLFKPCKGGLKSEGTGGFLDLKKNMPNQYPEQLDPL